MTLGNKLLKLRNLKNLSQLDIANQINVSQSTYNRWESDISKHGMDNLIKIARYHEIDLNDLKDDTAANNFDFSNSKFEGSSCIVNPMSSTINMHSPELLNKIFKNQEQLSLLIETQTRLIKDLLKKQPL